MILSFLALSAKLFFCLSRSYCNCYLFCEIFPFSLYKLAIRLASFGPGHFNDVPSIFFKNQLLVVLFILLRNESRFSL